VIGADVVTADGHLLTGNYVADEGDAVARAAYGSNYDRLAALKSKYDPTNLFRMNHNIKPSQSPAAAAAVV
jgi:FAD/FMN-containing dehydrogenase